MTDYKDKRKEEIVDLCFKIMKLWLDNPEKTLSWVLKELEKKDAN